MRKFLLLLGPLLIATAACTHNESMREPSETHPAGSPPAAEASGAEASVAGLVPSVHVEALADSVRFTLQVTNSRSQPVALEFSSGQSYDFEVRQGERELWRWSADRMFTQALRSETLGAGETLRYQAVWHPTAGTHGDLTVTGTLTVLPTPVEQSARFHLP